MVARQLRSRELVVKFEQEAKERDFMLKDFCDVQLDSYALGRDPTYKHIVSYVSVYVYYLLLYIYIYTI